jgi:hypothetical protein
MTPVSFLLFRIEMHAYLVTFVQTLLMQLCFQAVYLFRGYGGQQKVWERLFRHLL